MTLSAGFSGTIVSFYCTGKENVDLSKRALKQKSCKAHKGENRHKCLIFSSDLKKKVGLESFMW